MKICIVLGNYYKYGMGGSEIQAKFMADYLIRHGVDVSYVFHGERNSLSPLKEDDGFTLYQVKKPYKGMRPLNYFNKRFIFRVFDRISPDLIYCRGNLDFSDIVSLYSSKHGIPLVYGLASDVQSQKRNVRKNTMFIMDFLNKYFSERFYDRVDQFIVQSNYQKIQLKMNFGRDSIMMRNGHPPVPNLKDKDDPPRIIWVANVKDIKQPMLFVDLAEKFSDRNAIFTMIGRSDDDALLERLMKKIKDIDNIEYLGELSMDDANELLERSSVLVNTSKFEGFSNTFIQAWQRRVPVLSLNSDPDDILESNHIGHRSVTIEKMYRQLSLLLSNPVELDRMGNRAREYAVNNHGYEKIGAGYLALFKTITKDR